MISAPARVSALNSVVLPAVGKPDDADLERHRQASVVERDALRPSRGARALPRRRASTTNAGREADSRQRSRSASRAGGFQTGDVRACRPDPEQVGLPPVVEVVVLDLDRERGVLDVPQAGLAKSCAEVPFAGARELATRPRRRGRARGPPPRRRRAARPPAWSHTQAATIPSVRVTRPISRRPATGSAMKCTTSCARAASNASSPNGSASAGPAGRPRPGGAREPRRRSSRTGRPPTTEAGPTRCTSSAVSAPGPQPTSSTRWPRLDAGEVGERRGERRRVPAHEPVVGGGRDLEAHGRKCAGRAQPAERKPGLGAPRVALEVDDARHHDGDAAVVGLELERSAATSRPPHARSASALSERHVRGEDLTAVEGELDADELDLSHRHTTSVRTPWTASGWTNATSRPNSPGRGSPSISWAPAAASSATAPPHVVDLVGDVVHPGSALGQEPPDRRVVARRREQLDPARADEERGGLDALVADTRRDARAGGEEPLVGRDGLVEVGRRRSRGGGAAGAHAAMYSTLGAGGTRTSSTRPYSTASSGVMNRSRSMSCSTCSSSGRCVAR